MGNDAMCDLFLKPLSKPLPVGVSLPLGKRREALNLAPLPLQGRGWGLGLRESCTRRVMGILNFEFRFAVLDLEEPALAVQEDSDSPP